MVTSLSIPTPCQGLHEITRQVAAIIASPHTQAALSPDLSGLCTLFIRHTSASLLIQENADSSARLDLERWLNTLVPESGPAAAAFTHTSEGADDMPSHIKAALTDTSLAIPIIGGELALGPWQGIYIWEHRRAAHTRQIVIHIGP
jgi:secondary thiamine-phosphate synthase enzyme